MSKLLAYAPDERWAFVQDGARTVLVRPPFHQDVAASAAEVERAVTVHGFIALERDFATRRALLEFLRDESVRVWNERAAPKNLAALRDDLLAALTVADLDRHIARAQKKVDDGKFDEAQTLLTRLLMANALNREQRGVIAGMQQRAQSARNQQEEQRRHALSSVARERFARAARVAPPALAGGRRSDALHPAA
ncbi:MAG: hypothetical protein QM820_28155 [Minicystis sp.]